MLLTEDLKMYEDMMKDMQNKMKPVTDMAEINKSTAEKLISLHTEYMTDLFNSGLAQMKALSAVKEPKLAMELQVKYFKDLEAKLTNVAEQEISTLTLAKEQLTDLVEKGVSEFSDAPAMAEITKFMQTAQEKMTEAPAMADMTKFMKEAQEKMTEVPAMAEITKFMQTAQEKMTELSLQKLLSLLLLSLKLLSKQKLLLKLKLLLNQLLLSQLLPLQKLLQHVKFLN
jgi:hypothetical protein